MTTVKFAPLSIPLPRRLQTLVIFCTTIGLLFGPLTSSVFFVAALFTPLCVVVVIYGAYWFLFDYDISSRGGRRFDFMRRLPIWNYLCDYFPVTLHKTKDLDPDKKYLMGYHPHGIISHGAFASFATEGNGFSRLFPGIVPHLMTLKFNFRWPFHRDFLLSLGIVDVSKESLNYIFSKKGSGNAAIIVVGGAAEALEAHPHTAPQLVLKNRKGFVKIAIKNGAQLVPVYGFGENDLINQVESPWLRRIQEQVRHLCGISPVVVYGRGIFQYSFGFMPFRVPVHLVVGAPIEVEQCDSPTQEQIDQLHTRYMEELKKIYDEHKKEYSSNPEGEMTFI